MGRWNAWQTWHRHNIAADDDEELGGATMHAEISGTIDFKEPDDESCLVRLREVLGKRRGDLDDGPGERQGPVRPVREAAEIESAWLRFRRGAWLVISPLALLSKQVGGACFRCF